jgi:HD-like signal output (HDOD) protein
MSRPRIIFVDDDPNVLAGLRDRLRRDRQRWDMAFVTSGDSALIEFAAGAFDIIVSDMRMPGMDGAALLERIKNEYPETTRIVLSGQAEREAIIRALPFTHQFLSKPCDGDVVRAVLERICGLRALLLNETVKKIVGRVDRLPSIPAIFWELMEMVSRSDVGTAQIAAIVERDPAMTAKILQLVNSAYFGLAQHITSIQQALVYLGVDLVKGLTLTARVFESVNGAPARGAPLASLQKHSLLTAQLAQRFASGARLRDEAYTAAMVHDIGEVVLAVGYPDRMREARRPENPQTPQHVAEREVFGATHADVGAYLLGIWGLPLTIVEAVAFHHEPGQAVASDAELLAIVHVADALVHRELGDPAAAPLDMRFIEAAGLAQRLVQWEAVACKYFAMRDGLEA